MNGWCLYVVENAMVNHQCGTVQCNGLGPLESQGRKQNWNMDRNHVSSFENFLDRKMLDGSLVSLQREGPGKIRSMTSARSTRTSSTITSRHGVAF